MPAPFNVFASPFTAWLAPDGTVEPLNMSAAPPAAFVKLGANGSLDYDEDGVTVEPDENTESFRGLGATGVRKQWRTEEDMTVSFKIYDATPEHVAKVMGTTLITTAAATLVNASKAAPLYRGSTVATYALLLKSDAGGPYSDSYAAHFWIPRASISQVGELTTNKGEPMGTDLTFSVWQHETLGFGNYRAASAAAL